MAEVRGLAKHGPTYTADMQRQGSWLFKAGAACFGVGVVFILATFVPFLAGLVENAPVLLALATMLAPLGFAAVLVGLLRQARAAQRAVLAAAVSGTAPDPAGVHSSSPIGTLASPQRPR